MFLVNILVIVAIIGILIYCFEKLTRKVLGIKKTSESGKYVNKHHRWGSFFISLSFVFIFNSSETTLTISLVILALATFSFDAYMRWKYLEDSREYIMSIITGLFLTLLIALFLPYLVDLI